VKQTLQDFAQAAGGRLTQGSASAIATGVSIDTRTLKSGELFFALKGPRFDAHDLLEKAIDAGALALVIHRRPEGWQPPASIALIEVPETLAALQRAARLYRESLSATLIGITGSNGKTTTKEMLAAILSRSGKTLATAGNYNNHIGLPLTLLRLDSDHKYGVIEMGTSMPGDMDLLADLTRPQAALITNVGQDHLEFFGTPEGVLKENWKLYDRLSPAGLAVLNSDDPWLSRKASALHGRIIRYSSRQAADVYAKDIQPWPWPIRFTLVIAGREIAATLPVIGTLQVLNAVAAAAAAHGLGISAEQIVAGLAEFKPAAMRMQVSTHPSEAVFVNDAYNANPSSVKLAVESFCASFPKSKRWVVLGDMRELGDSARDAHRSLGVLLTTLPIDKVFLYGRDSRFIEEGVKKKLHVERYRKKRYLLQALAKDLKTEKPAILFKASRRLRLETLIQELMR
jgi:UDP-N-acetylmuramoyl-tripeptide--D-alanyl-D-alanine ligase